MISNTLKEGKRQYDADEVSREPLDPTLPPDVSQVYRNLWLFIWLKTIVSYDSGCFSAALGAENGIAEEWALSTVQQGTLSSSVFLGNVIGCLFAGHLFSTHHEKNVLLCTQLFHTLFTFLFATFPLYHVALFNRFMLGIALAFPVVYTPVWVDAFAPKERQSVWMASHNAGVPLGVMIGYVLGAFFPTYVGLGWEWAFYLKCVLMVPTLVYMAKVSSRTINASGRLATHHSNTTNITTTTTSTNVASVQQPPVMTSLMGSNGLSSCNNSNGSGSNNNSVSNGESSAAMSGIHQTRRPPWLLIGGTFCGYISRAVQECRWCWRQMLHSVSAVRPLFSNVIYMCSVLAMCSLYFVATGVQNFLTQYLRNEPFNAPMRTIMIGFGTSLVIAPVCGVIIGGMLLDRCGGYHGNLLFVSLFALVWGGAAATFATLCTYITTTGAFLVVMSLVLFCGGAIIPCGAGLTMASLPQSLRPLGAAFSQTVYNLLGNFSGPLVCGWVAEWTGQLRYGITTLLLSSIVGMLPVGIIVVIALRRRAASHRPLFDTATAATLMAMGDGIDILMPAYTNATMATTINSVAMEQQPLPPDLRVELADELKVELGLPADITTTAVMSPVGIHDSVALELNYLANSPSHVTTKVNATTKIIVGSSLQKDTTSGVQEQNDLDKRNVGSATRHGHTTDKPSSTPTCSNTPLQSLPKQSGAGAQGNFLRALTARRLYHSTSNRNNSAVMTSLEPSGAAMQTRPPVSPTGSLDSLIIVNSGQQREGGSRAISENGNDSAVAAARRAREAFVTSPDQLNSLSILSSAKREATTTTNNVLPSTKSNREERMEKDAYTRRTSHDSIETAASKGSSSVSSSEENTTRPFIFTARAVPQFMPFRPLQPTTSLYTENTTSTAPPPLQPVALHNTAAAAFDSGLTTRPRAPHTTSPCLAELDAVPTLSISDSFSFGMDVVRTLRHAHEETTRPVLPPPPPVAMLARSPSQATTPTIVQSTPRASAATPPPPAAQTPH